MSLSSLYQWIRWQHGSRARRPHQAGRRPRRSLEVECLEDRFLLSTGISEFPTLTSPSNPNGICLGPDGKVWFTEAVGNKIGVMNATGATKEFTVPTANAGLGAITAGPDGALWFIEEIPHQIGRITLSGTVTEFAVPTPLPIFV